MPQSHLVVGGMSFLVRRATADDVRAIVELLQDDPLGSARETSDWARYDAAFEEIDRDPNQFLAVIEGADSQLAGTMQLTLIPGLSRNAAKRLQIEAVRIAAPLRRIGLGAAMIGWAHEYGLRHGAAVAQLTTDKTRADALRFYESLGYQASHEGLKISL